MQIQFSQWDMMGFVIFDSIFGEIMYKWFSNQENIILELSNKCITHASKPPALQWVTMGIIILDLSSFQMAQIIMIFECLVFNWPSNFWFSDV